MKLRVVSSKKSDQEFLDSLETQDIFMSDLADVNYSLDELYEKMKVYQCAYIYKMPETFRDSGVILSAKPLSDKMLQKIYQVNERLG